jgi:hypothetical protein
MAAPTGIEDEFEGLSLGDSRLDRRALKIVRRAVAAPAESFPELLTDDAELEGAYRFFANDEVSHADVLAPHIAASLKRAREHRLVRIVHDTTALTFGGEREGLGTLGKGGNGFWAQMALIVSGGEERAPLGIVGLETKVYPTLQDKAQRHQKAVDKFHKENLKTFPKAPVVWDGVEKWGAIPLQLRAKLEGIEALHVMDQEADNIELFALLKKEGMRFVIRGSSARRIESLDRTSAPLRESLARCDVVMRRKVPLTARPKTKGSHPVRRERVAELSMRAIRATLLPTSGEEVALNVVEVFEPAPPEGEEAISWVLFTTETIDAPEEVAAIVDHYRARWRIEEYFKALKTGCSIEKRQLTTYDGLLKTLALFAPVAWRLLALRAAAHQEKPVPANSVMTPIQLTVLRALDAQRRKLLPTQPTARDVLFAVAGLGGHLKRNGDPGWLTLSRGYDKLLAAEAVWALAAHQPQRSDQS